MRDGGGRVTVCNCDTMAEVSGQVGMVGGVRRGVGSFDGWRYWTGVWMVLMDARTTA